MLSIIIWLKSISEIQNRQSPNDARKTWEKRELICKLNINLDVTRSPHFVLLCAWAFNRFATIFFLVHYFSHPPHIQLWMKFRFDAFLRWVSSEFGAHRWPIYYLLCSLRREINSLKNILQTFRIMFGEFWITRRKKFQFSHERASDFRESERESEK